MAIITLDKASLAFGHHKLLDQINFSIEKNDKFGLIGRNGAGKSSFLKALAGNIALDSGKIHYQSGIKLVYLAQEPNLNSENTTTEELMSGLGEVTESLRKYNAIIDKMATEYTDELLDELTEAQHELDSNNGWNIKNLVDKTITELELSADRLIGDMSGGMKKKVAIAKALVSNPDILLLDEPTNHLDINAIEWLEKVIKNFAGSVLLITHDRRFLDNTIEKILELDRGQLRNYPGNYAKYQETKARELEDESKTNSEFDKLLAQEEVWIRKGIQARRTRNEGRVRQLEELRRLRAERRDHLGQVKLLVDTNTTSGKIVAEIENIDVNFGERNIIKDFSSKILRGEKIGLIGANGVGKTTLLKAVLGELTPVKGKITLGTKLEVAYFDQLREQLDEESTIADVIGQGQDFVFINGYKKHIATYLEEFLFEPARFRSPVKSLSGGERNRLLLARLFSKPANVLVLDEPTNDLDMDTLEVLESLLSNYTGTIFLVSHDREFLDNVVTSSWVFLGDGHVLNYSGGFSDWQGYKDTYNAIHKANIEAEKTKVKPIANSQAVATNKPAVKLTFKEKQELEQLPNLIATLETEQQELQNKLLDVSIYKENPILANQYSERITEIDDELMDAFAKWEELEAKK